MPHDPEMYLYDMLDRATFLVDFLRDKSADDVNANRIIRAAVEREFSIIGEAFMQLHRLASTIAEQIDQWQQIIGFRHVLIHGYGVLEMETIVNIARNHLPKLIDQLNVLLQKRD